MGKVLLILSKVFATNVLNICQLLVVPFLKCLAMGLSSCGNIGHESLLAIYLCVQVLVKRIVRFSDLTLDVTLI